MRIWWPGKNAKRDAYRAVVTKLRYVTVDEAAEPSRLSEDARMRLGALLQWTTSQLWRIAITEHGCCGLNRDKSFPCNRCDREIKLGTRDLWHALEPDIAAGLKYYEETNVDH